MLILHLGLCDENIYLWAEKSPDNEPRFRKCRKEPGTIKARPYPFAADSDAIKSALEESGIDLTPGGETALQVFIPTLDGVPAASSPIVFECPEGDGTPSLKPWTVTAFRLELQQAAELLTAIEDRESLARGVAAGQDVRFLVRAYQFTLGLLQARNYLPGIIRKDAGKKSCFMARWEPVISGEDSRLLCQMAGTMPDSCRALSLKAAEVPDTSRHAALSAFVSHMLDHLIRRTHHHKGGKKRFDSVHDQWMYALASSSGIMDGDQAELEAFREKVEEWRHPVLISQDAPFTLCFRLEEPGDGSTGQNEKWTLRSFLSPVDDHSLLIPVKDAWKPDRRLQKILHRDGFNPRLFLLHSLGRAAGISPLIAEGLKSSIPGICETDTAGAFEFLSEKSWMLEQAGFTVFLPAWWSRKGAKKQFSVSAAVKSKFSAASFLSLDDLVQFDWKMALGDEPITFQELQTLARIKSPLVRFRGQWVQLNADEIQEALEFWKKKADKGTLRDLVRMELGIWTAGHEIPVSAVSAAGWIAEFLKKLTAAACFEELEQPRLFHGTLRPYQKTGYSWLDFLKKWGLGACLADDMGLGKTIQVLSLLSRDWEEGNRGPVLIICPTSVMGNWQKEASKFTPALPVMVHHGIGRTTGKEFAQHAQRQAAVISSYSLLYRDFRHFEHVVWRGVVLDEAQNIKNAETKQAKSARALKSEYRIALTGTPVENHVGDLWSLMEFLNPGFLGKQSEFRQKFHIPIHMNRDKEAERRLKRITSPFILRRLKTDRSIIADLPEKMEMNVYCTLTKEQASLYSAAAQEVIDGLQGVEGIQRKGLVLATISKLKQICNHPAQFLKDNSSIGQRSGKLERLTEMMEEIAASKERALIFTQFAEMGEIIKKHLQEALGREVFFLHGGTPQHRREHMVNRFQNDADAPDIFILSLKAGGTGLNLTGASHVFHFDRWWNPAVENQATDRAFRIGQTKNVEVHKFVCLGTIEEKIDDMIERKKDIANSVIDTGEGWITELSDSELRDIFALRKEAIGE